MQVVAAVAMEPPAGGDARSLKDAIYAVFRATCDGRPRPLRARAVRRLPRHRTAWRADSTDRDLRRAAPGDRQLALVGRAVLHPHRQAPAGDADRGCGWSSSARRELGFRLAGGRRPEPDQLVVKLDPSTGVRLLRRGAPQPDAERPARSRWTWSSPSRAARGRRPTRCCCTPRCVGDSTRFTRQDGVEETWRIMQPLLDDAAAGAPVRARADGARPRPTGSSPATAAGTGRGSAS